MLARAPAMKHRWPKDGTVISAHKTERECLNGCGIIKVTRHEAQGSRDVHWVEFWRDMERIEGKGTPVCEAVQAETPARKLEMQ